ncbi:nucleotide exchange factor GrpE [Kribbella sp. NPDC051770]|uniref:nucleotide exchange factor GrpE n=1 Tax=Kribbella sp. NPDC051770 TaxID=3155413 RepID=UPI00343694D3
MGQRAESLDSGAQGNEDESRKKDAQGNKDGDSGTPDPLAEARNQVTELTDRWRRTAAELDNFRKRSARESAQQRTDEQARVLSVWLPVLDNLELALEHAGSAPDGFVDGVRSIRDQALAVVDGFGYPRVDDRGEQFDPNLHEAVGTVPTADHRPGTVLHVVRPRYGEKDRVLRPAAVIVAAEQR